MTTMDPETEIRRHRLLFGSDALLMPGRERCQDCGAVVTVEQWITEACPGPQVREAVVGAVVALAGIVAWSAVLALIGG